MPHLGRMPPARIRGESVELGALLGVGAFAGQDARGAAVRVAGEKPALGGAVELKCHATLLNTPISSNTTAPRCINLVSVALARTALVPARLAMTRNGCG